MPEPRRSARSIRRSRSCSAASRRSIRRFIELLAGYGVLDSVDIVAVHGFPLDWNHWQHLRVAEEARRDPRRGRRQAGLGERGGSLVVRRRGGAAVRTAAAPPNCCCRWWSACTGTASSICRRPGRPPRGTRKPKAAPTTGTTTWDCSATTARRSWRRRSFPAGMGVCQWFHFEDHRLELGVRAAARAGSACGANRHQLGGLVPSGLGGVVRPPDVGAGGIRYHRSRLCFTPEHLGVAPHYTSPAKDPADFAEFARWAVLRYAPRGRTSGSERSGRARHRSRSGGV